jgi:hypothetical protein
MFLLQLINCACVNKYIYIYTCVWEGDGDIIYTTFIKQNKPKSLHFMKTERFSMKYIKLASFRNGNNFCLIYRSNFCLIYRSNFCLIYRNNFFLIYRNNFCLIYRNNFYLIYLMKLQCWGPQYIPVWTGAQNLTPTGIRSPDRPARSQSLYGLSYRAHSIHNNIT